MTKSVLLARYTRPESESPWNGAKQFGLDTSVKVNMMSAVHTTTSAINLGRAIARK